MVQFQSDGEKIYSLWHQYARSCDTDKLLTLYTPDATLESPLVPAILNTDTGILNGHEAILSFLEAGTKRRPNHLVRWYREPNQFFFNGKTLIWEYPRTTPNGDQIELVEIMLLDDGLIQHHRIYWGWFGITQLIKSATR